MYGKYPYKSRILTGDVRPRSKARPTVALQVSETADVLIDTEPFVHSSTLAYTSELPLRASSIHS